MQLKALYGRNLPNYNALFLGHHDALAAGGEHVTAAAAEAFEAFGFGQAHVNHPRLVLFGSVGSLLKAEDAFFEALNRLPFTTYINIGIESVDAATLAAIGKPLSVAAVRAAFEKMQALNRCLRNITITANFLTGDPLSPEHHRALAALLAGADPDPPGKGAVYLSPFAGPQDGNALLKTFFEIKQASRLPVYIYLIQRL